MKSKVAALKPLPPKHGHLLDFGGDLFLPEARNAMGIGNVVRIVLEEPESGLWEKLYLEIRAADGEHLDGVVTDIHRADPMPGDIVATGASIRVARTDVWELPLDWPANRSLKSGRNLYAPSKLHAPIRVLDQTGFPLRDLEGKKLPPELRARAGTGDSIYFQVTCEGDRCFEQEIVGVVDTATATTLTVATPAALWLGASYLRRGETLAVERTAILRMASRVDNVSDGT